MIAFANRFVDYVGDHVRRVGQFYRATRETRFRKRDSFQSASYPTGEDFHYASDADYFRLVELARDLDRNDMIVGQGISRMIGNVIQGGFQLDPQTGNPGVDQLIKYVWDLWSSDADAVDFEGEKTFNDLERIILRHVVVDGDMIVLPTILGSLQSIENQRLRTPYGLTRDETRFVIHGVQLNSSRRRVAYWLTDDDVEPMSTPDIGSARPFPARDANGNRIVMHVYYPRRMMQTRGVSRLAPVIDPAAIHDSVQLATLIARQVQSCMTLIRERSPAYEPDDAELALQRSGWRMEPDPYQQGQLVPLKTVAAGMMYTSPPGETVKGFTPTVPGQTHFDHAKQIMQIIAVNLDLPLIVFLLDATDTNFSGWRGAMDQAKIQFQIFQNWFASAFHRRVFLWKMRQWSTPGTPQSNALLVRLRERGVDVFAHQWVLPSWPYVEPLTDATADSLQLRDGLQSMRRIQGKRAQDWDVVSTEIVQDIAMIVRKAMEERQKIVDEFPDIDDPPNWRELSRIAMPQGVQMGIDNQRRDGDDTSSNMGDDNGQ